MRHFVSLLDLKPAELRDMLTLTGELKSRSKQGDRPSLLSNRVLSQIFEKPSLRTRASFEAAIQQLGGSAIFMSSSDAGLNGRESLPDIARVLSSYADFVVLRTFAQKTIDCFAEHSRCPVINGLSDDRHPCQALTDLFTIQEVLGDLKDKRIVYVGDSNNVATSLATGCAMLDAPIVLCSPPGYEAKPSFLSELRTSCPRAAVTLTSDPREAVRGAHIVYTDVWASMGQEAEAEARQRIFQPYQVNEALLRHAGSGCRFMHDLPARRGLEVTDGVMDGPQSIVFQQAENRMHVAKGLLVWLRSANAPS